MPNQSINLSDAKVLMVDDTPANIDVLRKVLTPEGYKLSFATNGEKALTIATRGLPDLILLDVMMPGMDGFETCQKLKSQESTKDIPVIFITAKTDTEDLVEGFRVGAVDYITKPFRQEEVCVRVHNHLQSRILFKQRDQLISNLRASEQRFSLLAKWSPIAIFQTDTVGHFVYTNPKWLKLFNLDQNQGLNGDWLTVVHDEDRPAVETTWQESIDNKKEFTCQFRVKNSIFTEEGEEIDRWVQAHATPLRGLENEEITGFVGTVEDITTFKLNEQRMLEEKETAEAAMREKSEFLSGMTHELRTPLNAIIGYSEILSEEAIGEDVEDIEKITSASKYLLDLINNLLDLSKVEANKMTLYLELFEIEKLVEEVTAIIRPLVRKNQNELVIDRQEQVTTMYADMTKVKQILYNLLSNACKFTKSGTISLRIKNHIDEQGAEWVRFDVADTGIGLTPEEKNRLFKKYSQANAATSRDYGGTGLGLVLSQQFCRMMQGTIWVESEKGKGSTFIIQIPRQVKENLIK